MEKEITNKNQVIKRKIVNEKIITSDIDKNGNFIMWWDPKLVRKKLKSFYKTNLVNKSENSINEINNSFNTNNKSKYLSEKDVKDKDNPVYANIKQKNKL